jgi:hypothetical protein
MGKDVIRQRRGDELCPRVSIKRKKSARLNLKLTLELRNGSDLTGTSKSEGWGGDPITEERKWVLGKQKPPTFSLWRDGFPGRGHCMGKGPEVGSGFYCLL